MPITNRQRAIRNSHIGSSDMAAILGVDPWRTAHDVWLEKTGRLIPRAATDVMQAGNRFESGVLDYAQEVLGPLRRNVPMVCPGTPLMANVDAVLMADPHEPVEVKTAGLFGPVAEFWGADGSDQVPDRVIIQAHVHLICTTEPGTGTAVSAGQVNTATTRETASGSAPEQSKIVNRKSTIPLVCHVPAFIGGRGFCMFEVGRNERIVGLILERAEAFWSNVRAERPPADSAASLQVVKRVIRRPGKTVTIDPALVSAWIEARAAASEADKAAEASAAAVLSALGDAEAGQAGGFGAVTYYDQKRRAYSVAASHHRVLRHRPKGL